MTAWRDLHRWHRSVLGWRNLAERRYAHFVELHQSGRWRHYFRSEPDFIRELRAAHATALRWAKLAPRPDDVGQPSK